VCGQELENRPGLFSVPKRFIRFSLFTNIRSFLAELYLLFLVVVTFTFVNVSQVMIG